MAEGLFQFFADFPANLVFPVAVFLMARYRFSPEIWTAPLMILGTQWYILFNVIAGASAIPNDLREVAENLGTLLSSAECSHQSIGWFHGSFGWRTL